MSNEAPGDRLEGWKEIAAYLRRDVRTVQRWEQSDGMPVHRHKRAQRPIPYAYAAELDSWWAGRTAAGPPLDAKGTSGGRRWLASAVALLLVAAAAGVTYRAIRSDRPRSPEPQPTKSIGVLPFLDLTEGMKEEEFADGMTEELIDRLNKVPGLRVPPPTASFYYKNKRVPLSEIAKQLGVGYLLDGSVRKSGARLRVAARLIRADTANIIWSETYDRLWNDILVVQDDIAGEVTKALAASIDQRTGRDRSN
jgi:TolB-like protein